MLTLWNQLQTLESVGEDSESVLHYAPSTGQSVIEDMLIMLQVQMREGLHHPCSQRECVISDEEVWRVMVICRERLWFWEAQLIVV